MLPVAQERWPIAVAGACVALGFALLVLALNGSGGSDGGAPAAPPIVVRAATPAPAAPAPAVAVQQDAAAASPLDAIRSAWRRAFDRNERAHVPRAWVAGFYPLYERAQRAFGVNWLLLASVHRQETAFSTADTTYRGLNFAGCCAGPMQFNVTNGAGRAGSTWARFRDAYRRAERPASYPHPTSRHPSVYDDFDAMMAAARLLKTSGAGMALDGTAWWAAYDYYGHDTTGVDYADDVIARAIGWSQRGFSINQPVDPALRAAVESAWGAPERARLAAAAEPPAKKQPRRRAARARG